TQVQIDAAVGYLHRHRVGTALVGGQGAPAFQIDVPAVQGAGNGMPVHQAGRQRAATVWTAVQQGEDMIVGRLEHGNVRGAGALHDTRALDRNFIDMTDGDPFARGDNFTHGGSTR